jgi:TetR/AcrR family transcriptional repressor of uid operon
MALQREGTRADDRRQQILLAAGRCFRESGFHGASIARISKAAGMSSGHIYHYFENKEAIIGAIVAQDLEHRLVLTRIFREVGSARATVRAHVKDAISRQLDPDAAALRVEMIAEAARNPRIAKIVQQADLIGRQGLAAAIRDIRTRNGHQDDPGAIEEMVELICALYGGVQLRMIKHPALTIGAFAERIAGVIECALYDDCRVGSR